MDKKTVDKQTDDAAEKFQVPQYLLNAKKDALQDCKILYRGRHKPMTESLMCFGWECGDGWNMNIATLSYQLEALNLMLYPKYRTRIEAFQIKEKFGYFTGYFDVVIDPPALYMFINNLAGLPYRLLQKVNYGFKTVVDREEYTSEEWDEISKEDFDAHAAPRYIDNKYGWKFEERDGKYYRNDCVWHTAKTHIEPTRHRLLFRISKFFEKVKRAAALIPYPNPTARQMVMSAMMGSYMEKCVAETERRCHDTCEYCGAQIGNKYSSRCETTGWIQYICKNCAKEHNLEYISQDGELCNPDGSVKMTKDEFKKYQCERFKMNESTFG